MHYLWWVPLTIIYYIGYTWLSKQNNMYGGQWLLIMFIYGALCPMWILVTRVSNNLIFDGMLYDVIMLLTYIFVMFFLKQGASFSYVNWLGVVVVTIGFVLIKI